MIDLQILVALLVMGYAYPVLVIIYLKHKLLQLEKPKVIGEHYSTRLIRAFAEGKSLGSFSCRVNFPDCYKEVVENKDMTLIEFIDYVDKKYPS